jgi:hypothetical protein
LLDEKRERAAESVLLEPKLVVRTSTVEDLVRPAAGEKRRSPLRVKR